MSRLHIVDKPQQVVGMAVDKLVFGFVGELEHIVAAS
jgi:hypothetical protein